MDAPTLRWGILGAGRIAQSAIIPSLHYAKNARPMAIASRNPERAKRIATRLSIPKVYGGYEALLADPDIDAIYIGLPNGLHPEWVCKAAAAGKHILCEKSLALNLEDAKRMRAACWSAGVLLMEGYMYRHHPQWAKAEELIRGGQLGHILSVDARLSGYVPAEDHRWDPELGGGALFDVTCYGINVARLIFDAEPTAVQAIADWDEGGVDRSSRVIMTFPEGGHAGAWGSFEGSGGQMVHIVGTDGELWLDRPFVPHFDPVELVLKRLDGIDRIRVGGANHYLHQLEYFSRCVLQEELLGTPGEDGVANVAVCVAAQQAASEDGTPPPDPE